MNRIVDFFLRMDAKAARAVMISLVLFGLVAMVFVFGKFFMDSESGIFGIWFEQAATRWYALPLTIMVFTLMSFLGAPQFALMAAAVLAFGPITGFFYAWISTLVAGSVNYVLGRYFGADILKRYGGDWANRISDFIGKNGLLASMLVRWVPSGPFIVVNMGFGVARTPYWAFALGLAIGSAPKIILVSLAGQSILDLLNGQNILIVLALLAAAGAWLGVMLLARRWLRRNRPSEDEA